MIFFIDTNRTDYLFPIFVWFMCRAWAPGHATLFFAVPKKYEKAIEMGSIGGGINVEKGVITAVKKNPIMEVYWNDLPINGKVTLSSVQLFNEKFGIKQNYKVSHLSDIPIGYGLSTSGAGAISTLLALNNLMSCGASDEELFQLAHLAEIKHHTGLGSVVGQITPGIELRLTQGGPGICDTQSIKVSDTIILIFHGPLDTSSIITSDKKMKQVTQAGIIATKKAKNISSNYTESYINIGNEFTRTCGLVSETINRYMKELHKIGEDNCAMAMIGETLVILPKNREAVISWANGNRLKYIETQVTEKKPFVM